MVVVVRTNDVFVNYVELGGVKKVVSTYFLYADNFFGGNVTNHNSIIKITLKNKQKVNFSCNETRTPFTSKKLSGLILIGHFVGQLHIRMS